MSKPKGKRPGRTRGKAPGKALVRKPRAAQLSKPGAPETIEAAYAIWSTHKLEHAAAILHFEQERRRLEGQGSFLVGAVRAAGAQPGSAAKSEGALARPRRLEHFLNDAEARLSQARQRLEQQAKRELLQYEKRSREQRTMVRKLVERTLSLVRPRLELLVRPAGQDRKILHLARVSPDEGVLLCFLFSGSVPSRYGYLFDDSTEDATLAPAPLYADEGLGPSQLRPGAAALRALVETKAGVLPVKGFIPVLVPDASGSSFFRLLERGPVMEVELQEGEGFRSILMPAEAERFAGYLLRLKLEGKIELEFEAG